MKRPEGASGSTAFVGSIPRHYDRCLGPVYFHPYADDLVARLPVSDGMRVLEVACGTGIVTARLARRLEGRGTIVATDLNEAMIGQARVGVTVAGIDWRPADGTSLPFPGSTFDAVVCQFGLMFFPDKAAGFREAYRVLRPGGVYLFNVWDAMERNEIARLTHETVARFFPADPPSFYTVPFGFHDAKLIASLLGKAGFAEIDVAYVDKVGESPSAAEAATGLIEGAPILGAIMERRPEAVADIEAALAGRIAERLGDHPVRCALRALVFTARRPA